MDFTGGLAIVLGMTFWAWVGIVLLLALLAFLTETELFDVGVFLLIIGGIIYMFWHGINPLPWLVAHMMVILISAVIYTGIGILWSFFKMDRYAASEAKRLQDDIERSADKSVYTKEYITQYYIPSLYSKSRKFTNWIFGWPFSMLAYILSDLIRELADAIVSVLKKVYTAITMRHFQTVLDAAKTDEEKDAEKKARAAGEGPIPPHTPIPRRF